MGNSAGKLNDVELINGTIGDGRAIAKSLVSSADGTTKIKCKGKTWVKYNDTDDEQSLMWTSRSVGTFKSHSIISDSAGTQVAIIVTAKKGIGSCKNFILRKVPSYEGQEAVGAEELAKAGIDERYPSLYKFAKIEMKSKMTSSNASYYLITSDDDDAETTPLYTAENFSMMAIKAVFKEAGSDGAVAKAYMPGMSMNPHVDAASGVDLLAIVSMGYALAGDPSSAGALAGAGVV